MHIIFVYNSNCGRQTLNKLLNKGGVFFSSRTWQGSWKKKYFFCLQSQVSDRKFSKILTTRKVPQKLLCLQSKANQQRFPLYFLTRDSGDIACQLMSSNASQLANVFICLFIHTVKFFCPYYWQYTIKLGYFDGSWLS